MIFVAAILGTLLPSLIGWQALEIAQRSKRVLYFWEQAFLSFSLGTLLLTFGVFIVHWIGMPISLFTFIFVHILFGLSYFCMQRAAGPPPGRRPILSFSLSKNQKILVTILGIWTVVKLTSMIVSSLLTPTYFDDALDNWSLRAKMYHETKEITLFIPGPKGPIEDGVGSYPPSVPLVKTWYQTLGSEWSEPLTKLPHILWYLSLIGILFFSCVRITGEKWALLGTYVFTTLPLAVLHGVASYADIFMALHTTIPILALYFVASQDESERESWISIAVFSTALLAFTKNEALLLQLPVIALLVLGLWKKSFIETKRMIQGAISVLSVLIPWTIFKFTNELTFGNAKSVSGTTFEWHEGVWTAIYTNTFFEANWNLLPILFVGLLIWKWKTVIRSPLSVVTVAILLLIALQWGIFMFTQIANEAVMQTGIARGFLHVIPLIVIWMVKVVRDEMNEEK